MLKIIKDTPKDILLGKFDKCLQGYKVTNLYKPFVKSMVTIWSEIQLAVAGGVAVGFLIQMIRYWDFSKTIEACKVNGVIGTCDRLITKLAGDGQVCNPLFTPNATLDVIVKDKANQKPLAGEQVMFTRRGPDGQIKEFPAFTNHDGIAKCEGCYIGEKEGDYTFTCNSIIDPVHLQ